MNSVCRSDTRLPKMMGDVIGIGGYDKDRKTSVVCIHANDDNNFLNEGIVLNSLVYVDTSSEFKDGTLNVFKTGDKIPFKLSRTSLPSKEYIGRIFLTVNQYEV